MIKETNLTISIKDMERSIAFYQSIGFELKQRWANHFAQLTAPGIVIGLHPSDKNDHTGSGNISIGFTTDDFEKADAFLKQLSIETTYRKEEGGDFIHFKDPDGTLLYFIKPNW